MKTFKQLIDLLESSVGHWITINAPKDKKDPDKHGTHVLIDKEGKVLTGAGGALTGKKLSNIKSKSKETSHATAEPKTEPKVEPKKDNEVWLYSDARSYEKKLKDFEQAKSEQVGNHTYSNDINQKLWHAQMTIEDEVRKWQRFLATPGINNPEKEEETKDNISAASKILSAIGNQRKYWKQRYANEIGAAANKASETAETKQEHQAAAELHRRASYAQQALQTGDPSTWEETDKIAKEHRDKSNEHEKKFKSLKRKEKLGATLAKKKEAKEREEKGEMLPHERFHPKSIQEIQQHFLIEHGLAIADSSFTENDDYRKKRDDYAAIRFDKNSSDEDKAKAKVALDKAFDEIWKKRATKIRGFHPVDMSKSNNDQVKGIKHLLTFVENSLNNLKSRGFDIDTVLKDQKIKYACGNVTGRPAGIAWGREWALSLKILNEYNNFHIKKNEEKRALAGRVIWGVSGTAETQEEYAQLVVVHELAHAIGIRQGSPERLDAILRRMYPKFQERKAWIKMNISEYGTTNIRETDAELCSRVLHKDYVPGTFPQELEDHVYKIFKKKQQ